MDALVVGELAVVGGCIGLVDGPSEYVVVWPTGTTLAGDEDIALDVPDVGRVEPGERVQLGGGYVSAPFTDNVPSIPEGCPGDEVAVANSDQSRWAAPARVAGASQLGCSAGT